MKNTIIKVEKDFKTIEVKYEFEDEKYFLVRWKYNNYCYFIFKLIDSNCNKSIDNTINALVGVCEDNAYVKIVDKIYNIGDITTDVIDIINNTDVNIISVNNYEIGNGIEAVAEIWSKYRCYLQLPNAASSEHCLLSNDAFNDSKIAKAIAERIAVEVDNSMSEIELNMLTEFGGDLEYYNFNVPGYSETFYIFLEDDGGHRFYRSSNNSYIEEIHDDYELLDELQRYVPALHQLMHEEHNCDHDIE